MLLCAKATVLKLKALCKKTFTVIFIHYCINLNLKKARITRYIIVAMVVGFPQKEIPSHILMAIVIKNEIINKFNHLIKKIKKKMSHHLIYFIYKIHKNHLNFTPYQ